MKLQPQRYLPLAAGLLLAAPTALAQPTKRDQPMQTPDPGGARGRLMRPAQPGAPGGAPQQGAQPPGAQPPGGQQPGPQQPGAQQPGGQQPGAPGGKIGAPDDIDYKPIPAGELVAFNMVDVDLPELVKAISKMTGRRFIFGGKVRQIKATIEAPTKVTVAEAYQAFLSVLETNGMTVIPHGRYLKIVETGGVASQTTPVLGTAEPVPDVDRFVTRLYRMRNVDAEAAANVLSKFKSRDGDITAYQPTNLLILTDTGANIRRMLRIAEEIDTGGGAGEQVWMQPVHNRSASDLAAQLNEMLDLQGGGAGKAKIIGDDRNNALVMVANEDDYKRLLELMKRLDVPAEGDDQIHVLPLQHAKCDELQQTLNGILGGGGGGAVRRTTQQRAGAPGMAPATAGGGAEEVEIFEGAVVIFCDEATNSLVTQSSLRDYAQLRNVLDKLDAPRRQVFIEAVIMDANISRELDWGIGYHGGGTADLGGGGDTLIYGGNNPQQSLLGVPASLEALAFGVRGPDIPGTANLLGTGVSIPAFGIVLHALGRDGDSNVLATPHILATDNIPAIISIGQNIPLQTNIGGLGNLAQLAGAAGGQQGAAGLGGLGGLGGLLGGIGFQAPRQDVGIKLEITPHVNDSDQVRMEIKEEFSDAGSPSGALGAVPINKRTAETTIIVKDQQTVVIGGLVRESIVNARTKIPVLGDIPVLGLLFRQDNKKKQKTNLLLILTPHIIRNQDDLREIFERKMQERQEFLDRYFIFDDSLPWEPPKDYTRTNGLLERIRQTQLAVAERERLQAELDPDYGGEHEAVKPLQLPSIAGAGKQQPAAPAATPARRPPRTRTPQQPQQPGAAPPATRAPMRVPGGIRQPNRYRVE